MSAKFYNPEQIAQARAYDLLSYLQTYNPDELVRADNHTYHTVTHDSLEISNGKWMWWSHGIGGISALDYLTYVEGMTFTDAVEHLLSLAGKLDVVFLSDSENREAREFRLPARNDNNDTVIGYLKSRGISENVISAFIGFGSIYEDKLHNMVAVGFDENMSVRFACVRGTGHKRFYRETYGSRKKYSFRNENKESDTLFVFEGVIDLLSFATLAEIEGKDWSKLNMLALCGIGNGERTHIPAPLENFLENNANIDKIKLCLDNDEPGILAADAIKSLLGDEYETESFVFEGYKDVNEYLVRGVLPSGERK